LVLDNYVLTRELVRLKKTTEAQAAQLMKLNTKFKRLQKFVWPLVQHQRLWVKSQKKKGRKFKKSSTGKRVQQQSSIQLGRNLEQDNLKEDAEFHADKEDKPQGTESQVNIESTKPERTGVQSAGVESTDDQGAGDQGTAVIQGTYRKELITPRTLDFEEEAGPSTVLQEEEADTPMVEHTASDDETVAQILQTLSRPRGVTILGVAEEQPQASQPVLDPKDKGKGKLVETKKKKKLTLAELRAIEVAKNEAAARELQAKFDVKAAIPEKSVVISRRPMSKAKERNAMMAYLKGQGYSGLQKLNNIEMKDLYDAVREAYQKQVESIISFKDDDKQKEDDTKRSLKRKRTAEAEQSSKKIELRSDTVDELRNYIRVVDFDHPKSEDDAVKKSKITTFEVVESKDGNYLMFHREDESFRVFNLLWDILHIIDRADLFQLYQLVLEYFEHIPSTGVGLVLLGDLTTLWETEETSTEEIWLNQENWEITSWRFFEESGVHALELEDGTMIHMLAERRYPLTSDLMRRMLDHGMKFEKENETALMVIELYIIWTTMANDEA